MRDENQAIEPAMRVALLRALGHMEACAETRCADNLAHHFLSEEWKMALRFRRSILTRFEDTAPGMYAYTLARTRFFDRLLEQAIANSIQQIIVIGSGYDSRPFRFHAAYPLTFVEVDTPATHLAKANLVRSAQLDTAGNRLVQIALDLNAQDLLETLASEINWTIPFLIIAEGVLYYLPPRFFSSVIDAFFAKRGARGSMLAFDYMNTNLLRRPDVFYGGQAVIAAEKSGDAAFPFTMTPADMPRLCANTGLSVIQDYDEVDIARLYLKRPDGTSLGRPLGGFHFCCAQVS